MQYTDAKDVGACVMSRLPHIASNYYSKWRRVVVSIQNGGRCDVIGVALRLRLCGTHVACCCVGVRTGEGRMSRDIKTGNC